MNGRGTPVSTPNEAASEQERRERLCALYVNAPPYRVIALIIKRPPPGPYRRPMPRVLPWS